MTISSSAFISQKDLAQALGISARRVRQLVKNHILPEANEDGFDREICHDRYDLYARGTEAEWSAFYDRIKADAVSTQRLIDKATKPKGSEKDLQKASLAVQALFSNMRFITAARFSSEAERNWTMPIWEVFENQALGALAYRACEIMAEKTGTTPENVVEQLEAEAA